MIRLVDRAEYKRRQAPPGIKITRTRLRPRPPPADHEPFRRLVVHLGATARPGRPGGAVGPPVAMHAHDQVGAEPHAPVELVGHR